MHSQHPDAYGRYGYEPTNPLLASNSLSQYKLLSTFRLKDGRAIKCERTGSLTTDNLPLPINRFVVYDTAGKQAAVLYVYVYHTATIYSAPEGFLVTGVKDGWVEWDLEEEFNLEEIKKEALTIQDRIERVEKQIETGRYSEDEELQELTLMQLYDFLDILKNVAGSPNNRNLMVLGLQVRKLRREAKLEGNNSLKDTSDLLYRAVIALELELQEVPKTTTTQKNTAQPDSMDEPSAPQTELSFWEKLMRVFK